MKTKINNKKENSIYLVYLLYMVSFIFTAIFTCYIGLLIQIIFNVKL